MKFNYSICYPDTEKIEYHRKIISKNKIIDVVNSHEWEKELRKDLKFYSPSIEINRITDKAKFIMSALGNGKLEEFMVMLIIPNNKNITDEFDDKQYKGAKQYEGHFSYFETQEMLMSFLDQQTKTIIESFGKNRNCKTYDDSLSTTEKWIPRIGGPLLTIVMMYVLIIMIKTKVYGWPLVAAVGFLTIFAIGSIRFEMNLRNKKT